MAIQALEFVDLARFEPPPRVAVGYFQLDGRWCHFEVHADGDHLTIWPVLRQGKSDRPYRLTDATYDALLAAYSAWRGQA
jgi:hypothetical protein